VLARQSEVFSDLFALPPNLSAETTVDGCQTVPMYDSAYDLSNLIKAIYDGPRFTSQESGVHDFLYCASILRTSTKYYLKHLRVKSIQHLTITWPITLKGHDELVERAINVGEVDGLTYPFIHPIHVLNLARSTNVSCVLPSAQYFLSIYPLADILRGDHPKLKKLQEYAAQGCPSSDLSTGDLRDYTLIFQNRINILLDFTRGFLRRRNCLTGRNECSDAFSRLASRCSRSWMSRTGPLHYMTQTSRELAEEPHICRECRWKFFADCAGLRQRIWDELPLTIGLPSWETLIEEDLREPNWVPKEALNNTSAAVAGTLRLDRAPATVVGNWTVDLPRY
jgi:hypothetical protein